MKKDKPANSDFKSQIDDWTAYIENANGFDTKKGVPTEINDELIEAPVPDTDSILSMADMPADDETEPACDEMDEMLTSGLGQYTPFISSKPDCVFINDERAISQNMENSDAPKSTEGRKEGRNERSLYVNRLRIVPPTAQQDRPLSADALIPEAATSPQYNSPHKRFGTFESQSSSNKHRPTPYRHHRSQAQQPLIYPGYSESAAPDESTVQPPGHNVFPPNLRPQTPAIPSEGSEEVIAQLEDKIHNQQLKIENLQCFLAKKDEVIRGQAQDLIQLNNRLSNADNQCISQLVTRGMQIVQELKTAPQPVDLTYDLAAEKNKTLVLANTVGELLQRLSSYKGI